ncbi:ABC transporter G family member 2 [Phytophthora citrophthora]|uniref:ABC transporter G family member 2 n=1 Tax=Phytophthora citrophthora TaxID=4793 RepID=A0AAD9LBV4_9STRA|nr:ABC transporter G family member 2 [Phytophthora citrophthora]
MYHGPRDQALSYFESLGFSCPPQRDTADFLLDLGMNQQAKYQDESRMKHPRWPTQFGRLFQESTIFRNTLAQLDKPLDSDLLDTVENHMKQMPVFQQSFQANALTIFKRQMMIMLRNIPFIRGRGFMVIFVALLYGSTFFQLQDADSQTAMGVLFQTVLFLGLGQAAQIPTYCNARPIFYKQRGANFLRTPAYVVANSLSQMPWTITESLVLGSLVYWMCGLTPSVKAVVALEVLLLLAILAFASWFFFLAAVLPNMHLAKPLSMVSIMIFVIFAGFIVPRGEIPDYFIWIYWINPIAWCMRGLAVNQFRSDAFDVCAYDGIDYCAEYQMKMGEYALSRAVRQELGLACSSFPACDVCGFLFLGVLVLEYKRYESPEHITMMEAEEPSTDAYTMTTTPVSRKSPTGTDETILLNVKASKNFEPVTIAFQDLWYSVPDLTTRRNHLHFSRASMDMPFQTLSRRSWGPVVQVKPHSWM